MNHLLRISENEFYATQDAPAVVESAPTLPLGVSSASQAQATSLNNGNRGTKTNSKVSKATLCLNCKKGFRHGGAPRRMVVDESVEVKNEAGELLDHVHLQEDSSRGFHPNCYHAVRNRLIATSRAQNKNEDVIVSDTASMDVSDNETPVRK